MLGDAGEAQLLEVELLPLLSSRFGNVTYSSLANGYESILGFERNVLFCFCTRPRPLAETFRMLLFFLFRGEVRMETVLIFAGLLHLGHLRNSPEYDFAI